jgi:hypothetical protein
MTLKNTTGRVAAAAATALGAAAIFAGSAGAVTDNVFRYSTAKTGYLGISVAAFVPMSSTTQFINNGVGIQATTTNQTCLQAPVNLPQGAVMKNVAVAYTANGSGTFQIEMIRQEFGTGANELLVLKALPDTGSSRKTAMAAIPAAKQTINNLKYNYNMNFCTQVSTQNRMWGARITYTYATAGD